MQRISKVVIPAAGLGTRLLSATKEQPKEMLPIFARSNSGDLSIKPIVQVIFEQLYDAGFREFYFIVGRNKRALEDHFTADFNYVKSLQENGKNSQASELEGFYRKIDSSILVWINQSMPLGFGHAVYLAKNLIGNEHFVVHAGDTVILSNDNHLTNLMTTHSSNKNSCTLIIREVKNPRQFGVVEGLSHDNTLTITNVEEKPDNPTSNLAIMPIYIFDPVIFKALEQTQKGKGNEIQLTDGIKKMLEWNEKVVAFKLSSRDLWIDVGTPETYWEAQSSTYSMFKSLQSSS
ncbi:UTP--glucose-1-phosphate uridylyltransferase [Candidatus Nitrososphaera sp. FF02]|uniref:UTP--glucose-1-phosphate uridylyltransferase n=1 Tax=Candidatus Nitrososphaera sp. FF02 TaxID=3398226 RepID=UPI0039ECB317